jgi:hypothetical protein
MRETLRWPLLIGASALALGALAILDAPGFMLAVLALWFLLVCTGMAFLPMFGTRLGQPLELGIILATSVALDTVVATLLTLAGSFSGTGVFLALGGLCLIGCGLQVGGFQPGRPHADPWPRARPLSRG